MYSEVGSLAENCRRGLECFRKFGNVRKSAQKVLLEVRKSDSCKGVNPQNYDKKSVCDGRITYYFGVIP